MQIPESFRCVKSLSKRLFKGQANIQKNQYTLLMSWFVGAYKVFDLESDVTLAASILNSYATVKLIRSKDLQLYACASAFIATSLSMDHNLVPLMDEWVNMSGDAFNVSQITKAVEDIYLSLCGKVLIPTTTCFLKLLSLDKNTLNKAITIANILCLTSKYFKYYPYDVAECIVKYVNGEETYLSNAISNTLTKLSSWSNKLVINALTTLGYTADMYTAFAVNESIKPPTLHSDCIKSKVLLSFKMDEFKRQRTLGEGGYGTVYSGTLDNQKIAIKKQDSDAYPAALKEIAIMSMLDHPLVESSLGIYFDDSCYFSMNLRKTCLHDILYPRSTNEVFSDYIWIENRTRPYSHLVSLSTRRSIGKQILNALIYLHSNGVIHGDVKPPNILLDEDSTGYTVKVTDFGISSYEPLLSSGEMIAPCTVHYRPIEHLGAMHPVSPNNRIPYSYEVDIWAFGLVLAEMEVGCHPVNISKIADYNTSSDSTETLVRRRYERVFGATGRIVPRCLLNNGFSKLCMEMLQFDPTERITATQALFQLQTCMC